VGHLNIASGVTGLSKRYCLKHRLIPPTLHFHTPDPPLILKTVPFTSYGTVALEKQRQPPARRGKFFGIGGTMPM